MFTLQILDRGDTSLFALDDRAVVVGSGAGDDLKLGDAGVEAAHLRIEPIDGGWKLTARGRVLVNGRAAQVVLLSLGDRIECGKAVLVVGKSVPRARRPDEVLADAPRRRREPAPQKSTPKLAIGAGVLLLGAVGYLFATQGGDDGGKADLAQLRRLQSSGELERAEAMVVRLRGEWGAATDERLAKLDEAAAYGDSVRSAIAAIEAEVTDPADTRNWAAWNRELQQRESGADERARVAARRVRGNLRELLDARARLAATNPAKPEGAPPVGVAPVVGEPAAAAQTVAATANAADWLADARGLVERGLFAQAEAALSNGLGEADSAEAVASLEAARAELRTKARAAMHELLARAEELLGAGSTRDAVTMLAGAQHRWPADAEFAPLADGLRRAEAAARPRTAPVQAGSDAGAVGVAQAAPNPAENKPIAPKPIASLAATDGSVESTRAGTLSALRGQLEQARLAEERDDFVALGPILREAAAAVRARDGEFAARLDARAEEAQRLAAWQEAVAAAVAAGRSVVVRLRDGRAGDLVGIDRGAVRLRADEGEVGVRWAEVSGATLETMLDKLAIAGDARFGAVALLYRGGERDRAEAILARVLRAEPQTKAAIDLVIARGRDEPVDPRGYTLQKDGFVSARRIDSQKLAKTMGVELAAALRGKDASAWSAFLDKAMERGPEAVDAIAEALRGELLAQATKLEASGIKKQYEKLAAQRAELDRARDHARNLIYDEVKYFYPYKPPAVSSEKFAEYNRVQAEVNARVAALRELWNAEGVQIKVPASLRGDLDRIDWLVASLAGLGDVTTVTQTDIGWARALPAGDAVGIREFCLDATERAELEEWRRIDAYNAMVEKKVAAAVREQLHITNAYRAMFRHRPLALVPSVCLAAQGHADEMSKLGYFAHMSPTPGRKTPTDRMRLAGYTFGVTENIALVDGAQGAHDAWCRSSGHHRNLLNARHTEFGVGANGRYWVQNFGSGAVYTETEMWRDANVGGKKR
ncbi:MAG: hypothetical protein RL398_1748 [Planctomycetota bacterium]